MTSADVSDFAFERHMREIDSHQIEKVGKEMRKMMWPDSTE